MDENEPILTLAGCVLDGVAQKTEVEELASALRADPAARRLVARLVYQHGALRWMHGGQVLAGTFGAAVEKPRSKHWILAAAAGLFMAIAIFCVVAPNKPVGSVESASAEALLERGRETIQLQAGMALQAGDVVHTGKGGALTARFAGRIELSGRTRLRLASSQRLELEIGSIDAEIGEPIVVASPHAEVEVIGTRFAVSVGADRTRVQVEEGSVKVVRKSDRRSIALAAGEYATAAPGAEFAATPVADKSGNLIKNGDFETGDLRAWDEHDAILSAGARLGEGFKFSGALGAQIYPGGGLGQRFATRVGHTYHVSFRLRLEREVRRPVWGGIRVSVYPESEDTNRYREIARFPFVTSAPDLAASPDCRVAPLGEWRRYSFSFVATTFETTLRISHFTDGAIEAWADDVVVSTREDFR